MRILVQGTLPTYVCKWWSVPAVDIEAACKGFEQPIDDDKYMFTAADTWERSRTVDKALQYVINLQLNYIYNKLKK